MPWQYNVTACIPHRDTPDMLRACLACLRWQTEPPYIHVIDTGSQPAVKAELESLNSEDCEVHFLSRGNWRHPSGIIAAAMDCGMAMTQTERHYCTHVDVLLKQRDWLAHLCQLCTAARPVVGYEMSPREWITDQWRGMVGHTSTMLYMPTMWTLGAAWNMTYAGRLMGVTLGTQSGWPDTESGFNLLLRNSFVRLLLVGHETNEPYYEDDTLIHLRSYTARKNWAQSPSFDREKYAALVADTLRRVRDWTAPQSGA